MKILLVGNYINDCQNSMQLFCTVLQKELTRLGHKVKVIRPKPFFGRVIKSPNGTGKWLGYIDKFFIFPRKLVKAKEWADVVHICDHSNAFYINYVKDAPNLVTCHDLIAVRSALGEFKENKTKFTGRILQKIILNGLNKCKKVVCVSEKTGKDLSRISKLDSKGLKVVYYGLNYPYSKLNAGNEPFILHVGANQWYKNRLGILKIFNELMKEMDISLIMAGKPFTKEMKEFVKNSKLESYITELGNLDSKELCKLYSGATALIFPSLEEGFGWPIIEAQACGCPVFTSNKAPMTEIGGKGAVYIDSKRPKEAAKLIVKGLKNKKKMVKLGFENVKRFSAQKMAKEYEKVYKELLR